MKAWVLWSAAWLSASGCVIHSNVGNEGDGSVNPDAGGRDGGGRDAGGCGPGNCTGCCQGNTCLQGNSGTACGLGGAACASCGAGSFCNVAGACELNDGGACGPSNCSGCCVGSSCFPGDLRSACGAGGAACSVCQSGWVCGAGSCQPGHGPGDGGWTIIPSGTVQDLRGVWAIPGNAWAVGANGTILRWDGGTWAPGVQGLAPYDLWGVWGASATQAWAVGSGGVILQWNSGFWSGAPGMPFQHVDFRGIAGTSASDIWAVGIDTSNGQFGAVALHWDGSTWSGSNTTITGAYPLVGVTASVAGAVAVTPGPWLIRDTASGWVQASVSLAPTALSSGVCNFQDTWVTTADGGVFNTIGGSWNGTPTGVSSDLRSITVIPPNHDVWAVGDQGAIVHSLAGGAWAISASGTPENLHSIWAASSNELWAVGDQGTILHSRPNPPVWTACGAGLCDMNSEMCVYPCCGGIPLPDGGICTPPPPFCVAAPSACFSLPGCTCFQTDPCQAEGGTCEGVVNGDVACICA
jgi:hypothetical protein